MNKILCISSFLILSACTSSHETFDTSATKGVGAKSISQVNKMVEKGEIKGVEDEDNKAKDVAPLVNLKDDMSVVEAKGVEQLILSDKTIVQRQPEQHIRVWIAPFQDEMGNFHEESVIHTLLSPSYWQMNSNPYNSL